MMKVIVKTLNTKESMKRVLSEEKGLTTVEWIILCCFVGVIAIGLGTVLSPIMKGLIGRVGNLLNTANNQQF